MSAIAAALPAGTTIRILASHKAGHVVPCLGLATALGVSADVRQVDPRGLYLKLAPLMPPDPRDIASGALAQPWPDIVLASARETVAYARALKKRSDGRIFTVFLGDPRMSRAQFDLIWAPQHDRISGGNVLKTLTAPHPHSAGNLDALRLEPDVRLAALSGPRVALLIGGPSGRFRFSPQDILRLGETARQILDGGASLMVSPSRRTPGEAIAAIARACGEVVSTDPSRVFLWDGSGANPFAGMLALADAFVVTADSVNMIGEAASTGRPVHLFMPSGDLGKTAQFVDGLTKAGAVRPWAGTVEHWNYAPLDATQEIAADIVRRYAAFHSRP